MINKKTAVKVIIGFFAAMALGWTATLIKVIMLGSDSWQGSVKVFFIPVAKIDNGPDGFTIETTIGLILLGIIGGVIGYLIAKKAAADSKSTV